MKWSLPAIFLSPEQRADGLTGLLVCSIGWRWQSSSHPTSPDSMGDIRPQDGAHRAGLASQLSRQSSKVASQCPVNKRRGFCLQLILSSGGRRDWRTLTLSRTAWDQARLGRCWAPSMFPIQSWHPGQILQGHHRSCRARPAQATTAQPQNKNNNHKIQQTTWRLRPESRLPGWPGLCHQQHLTRTLKTKSYSAF